MHRSGFVDIEVTDVTPAYIATVMAWKRAWETDSDALIDLVGEDEYMRRINNRSIDIANARDGLVRRYRIYGTKP